MLYVSVAFINRYGFHVLALFIICKIQKCMYKNRNVIIIIGPPGLTRYREVVLIIDAL